MCTINICNLSPKSKFTLNKFIQDENILILSIGETESTDPEVLELNNMSVICDTNNATNKGAALYVNDRYSLTKLEAISKLSTNLDSCWGLVVIEKKRYIIGSIYVKRDYNRAMSEVSTMLNAAEELQRKHKASGIILTGDFNARHFSWGDKLCDKYGNKLVEVIDNTKYTVCTSATPTFLATKNNGSSIIDLFIVSNNLVESIQSCYTNEEVELHSGSPNRGHVPVIAEMVTSSDTSKTPVTEKLDMSTMEWNKWTQYIEDRITNEMRGFENETNPDILWTKFDQFITESTNLYCKTKKSSSHSKPYWTPALTILSKNLRKARKNYIYRNTDPNLQKLQEAKTLFDEERKLTCEKFLIDTAKNLNAAQAQKFWKDFNKIFKKKTKQKVDPLINENDEFLTENNQLDKCLFGVFFEGRHLIEENFDDVFYREINNIYDQIMNDEFNTKSNEELENSISELNRDITIQEIKKAIRTTGKSVDNYNVHPLMLKNLGDKSYQLLQKIFNLCLRKHIWIWNKAQVIFLRKPGKDSYSKPGSYRPICITAYIGKLLENIITIRIETLIILIGKTDPNQEGFSAKKNTIRYLSRLILGIEDDKENNLTTLGLFVDFEKAFDSVWKRGLMVKLHEIGIRGDVAKLINNFLFSRKIKLNINGEVGTERTSAEYGLPQGSVISPVLFKIYVMDLVSDLLQNPSIKLLKFADDGTLKITAKDTHTCIQNLNIALESLNNWSHKWRLKINCDKNKTEIICFNSAEGDKSLIPMSFKLGNKEIHRVNETKVLGVIIDEQLTFKSHSEMILKALLGRWATICRYANKHWGFKIHVMILLLKTLFLSKIWYADHIWQTKRNIAEINKLFYKMIKSIIGAVLNIKQNIAEIILGIPPIHIQTKIHSVKHFLKINNTPVQNDAYKSFITDTYNQETRQPRILYTKLKDVFNFLEWKLKGNPSHFNNMDQDIINRKLYKEFTSLSPKACTYTKNMIQHYTEDILWKPSVIHQFQLEGYAFSPTPTCDMIPVPNNITREEEVQLLSLFYKNNLLNQSLYNIDRVPSPNCSKCKNEEETADHLLFRCDLVEENLRQNARDNYRKALKLVDGDAEPEVFIGLLDASRSANFIKSCVEIVRQSDIKIYTIL